MVGNSTFTLALDTHGDDIPARNAYRTDLTPASPRRSGAILGRIEPVP